MIACADDVVDGAVDPGCRTFQARAAGLGLDPLGPVKRSSCLRAKARQTSCWPAVRTFAQNAPASRIFGQLDDLRSGRKATSGGSSETDVKVPTTMPIGSPSV